MSRDVFACPDCGYLITRLQMVDAITDLKCPRCSKHRFSEFKPSDFASQEEAQ